MKKFLVSADEFLQQNCCKIQLRTANFLETRYQVSRILARVHHVKLCIPVDNYCDYLFLLIV